MFSLILCSGSNCCWCVQPHLKSIGTSEPNSRGSPFCFSILIFETIARESYNVSITVISVNKLSMRECHGFWWATIHERLNIVGRQYFSNAAVHILVIVSTNTFKSNIVIVVIRPSLKI
ncbi:hypothetical protein P167DRAFT_294750 [Morchella conica CCBAS932]|uniref:Uncharacterized protein n=1 Tax=Morchella conica CCBAS932 TaxID=1392247 RepID=A0A3N4KJR7_9PEZI|nr:hypothetical protein P167DRAFT_294750 [Morchella conica CCBAS932]